MLKVLVTELKRIYEQEIWYSEDKLIMLISEKERDLCIREYFRRLSNRLAELLKIEPTYISCEEDFTTYTKDLKMNHQAILFLHEEYYRGVI